MARMPDNPALLVVHANFLIEVRKDGQAARTQMQLAIKANPSLLDNYNIFVAQQLAKALKRGEIAQLLAAKGLVTLDNLGLDDSRLLGFGMLVIYSKLKCFRQQCTR